jgi:hypothetical protein
VQATALGIDPAYVWVPHPIQDRTDAELQALADKHLDDVISALTGETA